jgi:hypothetical protein
MCSHFVSQNEISEFVLSIFFSHVFLKFFGIIFLLRFVELFHLEDVYIVRVVWALCLFPESSVNYLICRTSTLPVSAQCVLVLSLQI